MTKPDAFTKLVNKKIRGDKQLLDDAHKGGHGFRFVDSCREYFLKYGRLTPKQRAVLSDINFEREDDQNTGDEYMSWHEYHNDYD